MRGIVELEHPDGAVVQFGGQTAIKLAKDLMEMGVPILGTAQKDVDAAEDRELFDKILEECEIPRPKGKQYILRKRPRRRHRSLAIRCLYGRLMFWADRGCRLQ